MSQLVYLHLGASEQKLARIRESVLAMTRGWDQTQVSDLVREALDEVVEPIIYAEALELIEQHRAAGRETYIVSASPEEIVQPLAEYLGVDGAIASRAVVDLDGRYTGEMAFYAYGPFKADAIRSLTLFEGIDLDGSYAYSDSYTDVPMLEVGGPPGGRQPRPGPGPAGPRARVGDPAVLPAGPPARPRARPQPAHGRGRHRGGAGRVGGGDAGVALQPAADRQLTTVGEPGGGGAGLRPGAQASRSRLAATNPRATRMARISSFFTAAILPITAPAPTRGAGPAGTGRLRR